MKERPLVSVCIPVYNRGKFIKAAVESVLSQTYQNFEIIIVDDGSTDNSIAVVKSIEDSRIKLFKNAVNKGVVYSRNRYLEEASGDYIAVLDSDDTWLPSKLEKQIKFFRENPDYGICGTTALRKYSDGKKEIWKYPIKDGEIRVRLLWGSSIIHSSMMINTRLLKKYSVKYSKDRKQAEDYDLIRQIAKYGKLYNLEEVLLWYNIHEDQFTSSAKLEQVSETFKVTLLYIKDLGLTLTEKQKGAYFKVFTYKYDLSKDELLELQIVFEHLNEQLDEKPILKNNISKQWFLACYYSTTKNGFEAWKSFNSLQIIFPYRLSLLQKGKFCLKCLVQK